MPTAGNVGETSGNQETIDDCQFPQDKETLNEMVKHNVFDSLANSEELDEFLFVKNPLFLSNVHSSAENKYNLNSDDDVVGNETEYSYKHFENTRNDRNKYGNPFVLFKNADSVESINAFKDLKIDLNLKKNLCTPSYFEDLSSFQRWSIPAILSRQNVVAVGSTKTGKTFSYIVAIVHFVRGIVANELHEGNGPIIVILCSSSLTCTFIYETFCRFIKNNSENEEKNQSISVVMAHGNGREKTSWVKLTNGCHILISTPHCLLRLLKMPFVTNLERLRCLVLDELDVLSQEPFISNVKLVIEKAEFIAKNQNYQKIVCSRRWTPEIENLIKFFKESYILIMGSYLEAAVFAKLKPKMYFVDKNHKLQIICDEIKNKIGQNKILVVCENFDESRVIKSYFEEQKIDSVEVHEYVIAGNQKEIMAKWNAFRPLVVTDGVLNELKIDDADVLVHYTLTKKSKTNFFNRFSTIFSGVFGWGPDSRLRQPLNLIFLDEENYYQLPQMIDYVRRLGGEISSKLCQISIEISREIEKSKESPICNNLLRMGHCRNLKYCSQRHAFIPSIDSPLTHFTDGWISFSVVKVYDASKFCVKLIQHFAIDGTVNIIRKSEEISQALNDFYNLEFNRQLLGSPKIGSLCAVKNNRNYPGLFYRAEIIDCFQKNVTKNDEKNEMEFYVRLIDVGNFMSVKKSEMYELPFDLIQLSPLTVDVILSDIHPMDFDLSWSRKATDFTNHLLTLGSDEKRVWLGKIVLALKNILFLESVVLKQFLPGIKANSFDIVLEEEILNHQFAVRNKKHLQRLIGLCNESGIKIPKENGLKKENFIANPRFTLFDDKIISVVVSRIESLFTIFLRYKKFENLLAELESSCQMEAKKIFELSTENKNCLSKLSSGMYCLALFDEKWRRGRIESENNFSFKVYFIDHGDLFFVEKKKVFPILNEALLQLPAQAVECSLIGIRSLSECTPKLVKAVKNFASEEPCLYALVRSKNAEVTRTRGPKYKVHLFNSKGLSLCNYLFKEKMIDIDDSEAENIDDRDFKVLKNDLEKRHEENLESCLKLPKEEGNKKEKPEINFENYFTQFSDEFFTNENESLFLDEFASKVFINNTISKTEMNSKDDNHIKTVVADESCKNSVLPKIIYKKELKSKEILVDMDKTKEKPKLKIRNDIRTPQVFWRQDKMKVFLKISLINVEKYKCNCTTTNILFRSVVNEKFYAVDLKLFGGIDPEKVTITLKTFDIFIVLLKLCPILWPRLHRDEGKHHWIHTNSDGICEQEDNLILKTIEKVQTNINSGVIKEGFRTNNLRSFTDSESSNGEEESDSMPSDSE